MVVDLLSKVQPLKMLTMKIYIYSTLGAFVSEICFSGKQCVVGRPTTSVIITPNGPLGGARGKVGVWYWN